MRLILPLDVSTINLYIAHLARSNYSYSTIKSHISALSFQHKARNLADNTNSYIVKRTVLGTKGKLQSQRIKPISRDLLHKCVKTIDKILYDPHYIAMYKSLFTLAYYACLRAGEAVDSNGTRHTITYSNTIIADTKVTLKLDTYKHSKDQATCVLTALPSLEYCPVKLLRNYVAMRNGYSGTLYRHPNGSPTKRTEFAKVLKQCVKYLGLCPENYNTHSLRIGRATDLALLGIPDHIIKATGRWKSQAYLKYIRFEDFHLPM